MNDQSALLKTSTAPTATSSTSGTTKNQDALAAYLKTMRPPGDTPAGRALVLREMAEAEGTHRMTPEGLQRVKESLYVPLPTGPGQIDRLASLPLFKGPTVGEALGPDFLTRAVLPDVSGLFGPPTIPPETLAGIRTGVKQLIREVMAEIAAEEKQMEEAQNGR